MTGRGPGGGESGRYNARCGAQYPSAARACLSVFGKSLYFKHGQTRLATYACHVRSHNSLASRRRWDGWSTWTTHSLIFSCHHHCCSLLGSRQCSSAMSFFNSIGYVQPHAHTDVHRCSSQTMLAVLCSVTSALLDALRHLPRPTSPPQTLCPLRRQLARRRPSLSTYAVPSSRLRSSRAISRPSSCYPNMRMSWSGLRSTVRFHSSLTSHALLIDVHILYALWHPALASSATQSSTSTKTLINSTVSLQSAVPRAHVHPCLQGPSQSTL